MLIKIKLTYLVFRKSHISELYIEVVFNEHFH